MAGRICPSSPETSARSMPCLPSGDVIREHAEQLLRLLDERRHEHPAQEPKPPRTTRIATASATRSGMRAAMQHAGERPEVQRDQDAEEEQEKNLSDGLEQPEEQDCQDRRRQDRRELESPRAVLRRSTASSLRSGPRSRRHGFLVPLSGAERLLPAGTSRGACPSSASARGAGCPPRRRRCPSRAALKSRCSVSPVNSSSISTSTP